MAMRSWALTFLDFSVRQGAIVVSIHRLVHLHTGRPFSAYGISRHHALRTFFVLGPRDGEAVPFLPLKSDTP